MSPAVLFGVAPVVAAAMSLVLTPVASRVARAVGALDQPGDRKVHLQPTPRLGGMAVIASVALTWGAAAALTGWTLAPGLAAGLGYGILPVLAISVVDDIRSMKAWWKLLAQVLGATIAVALNVRLNADIHLFGAEINIGALAMPLSVIWIVGVTNAFNMIDGLDGLSAGLALISSASLGLVFLITHQVPMAIAAVAVTGALAGFLPYNLHPARVFLGDTGATAIGFCLATFALRGGSTLSSGFAVLVPVFILGLPIADTLIAMARRTIGQFETRAGGAFVADANHIHHRLLRLGIDYGRAVLILYATGLAFAGVAFASLLLDVHRAALLIVAVVVAGLVGVRRLGYDEFAFIRRGTVLRVYDAPVFKKAMFVVFVDLVTVAVAAYVAVALKGETWHYGQAASAALDLATTLAPITVLVFWRTGLYRGSWRVADVSDFARVVSAVGIVTGIGIGLQIASHHNSQSVSLLLVDGLVSLVLVTASRASYVLLVSSHQRASNSGTPVLVYGADRDGAAAALQLFQNPGQGLRPVGFVDDDPHYRGRLVSGLPVVGATGDLLAVLKETPAKALIVPAAASQSVLEQFRNVCRDSGLHLYLMRTRVERLDEPAPSGDLIGERTFGSAGTYDALVPTEPGSVAVATAIEPAAALCPRCRKGSVHRSHSRTLLERIRKHRGTKRLYRCDRCGWRGWMEPLSPAVPPGLDFPTPDLAALDSIVGEFVGSVR